MKMFKKIGRNLIQGARAEILEPENETDWRVILEAGVKLLELGLFAVAIFSGGKRSGNERGTVIINNYICKGEEK